MHCIVGLGNPGKKYEQNRHNIGFRVVDDLASQFSTNLSWKNKFENEFVNITVDDNAVIVVKPQKYMNLSGEALAPLLRFFKIETDKLIVIHDELDLPSGIVRVKFAGSASHNGVSDIIQHLGTREFYRIRVGIGRPEDVQSDMEKASNVDAITPWVLGNAGPKEQELLDKAVRKAQEAIRYLIIHGLAATQQEFNHKIKTTDSNKETS